MRILPLIIAVPLIGIATSARSTGTDAASTRAQPVSSRPAESSSPRTESREEPLAETAVGGPLDDSPLSVVEHLAEEDEDQQHWLGTPDPALERRYAPTERQPLNSVTIRFWQ